MHFMAVKMSRKRCGFVICSYLKDSSLKFIRLLRVVFSVTEGVITTRSNRMKFRLKESAFTAVKRDVKF